MSPAALKPLCDAAQRYAGWLGRERTSVTVQADVQAPGIAIEVGIDPSPLLPALDVDIARPEHAARRLGSDASCARGAAMNRTESHMKSSRNSRPA